MNREEAIKILKEIRVYECYPKSASEETKEAIALAIEALENKPTPCEKCEECIHNGTNKDKITCKECVSAKAVHESCKDCPLYDKEKHNCPRFNKVIPRVLEECKENCKTEKSQS